MAVRKRAKFLTPRTAGFVKRITDEYINRMNQEVLYYSIDAQKTDEGDLYSKRYGEATKKYAEDPILVECSVYLDEKSTENFNDVGYELRTFMDVFFHIHTLDKLNIKPTIGDIISFQGMFFEVFDTDDHNMLHGDPEYKYGWTVNTHDIRINDYDFVLETDVEYKKRNGISYVPPST